MRRKPLIASAVFFLLFIGALWLNAPPPEPLLAFIGGRLAFVRGKHLRWMDPTDGKEVSSLELPHSARLLLDAGGALAYVPEKSDTLQVLRPDGRWERLEPPQKASGEGRWAAAGGTFFFLKLRPALLWSRTSFEGEWKTFLASDEELENPVDLSAAEGALAVLNQDPSEAVVFNSRGNMEARFPLTRDKLWPLQRFVFEAPLDYLRPRRSETPRRLAWRAGGRLAVFFTAKEGGAPRLVVLDCKDAMVRKVYEILLALRGAARHSNVTLKDFAWLPDGGMAVTSQKGGLLRYGPDMLFKKEWVKFPPPPSKVWSWTRQLLPWFFFLAALAFLGIAAWPSKGGGFSRPIPARVWGWAVASLLIPGFEQAYRRRWGWACFWMILFLAWGALAWFLTRRLRGGLFVTPATYLETWLGFVGAALGSAFQAAWAEWTRFQSPEIPRPEWKDVCKPPDPR